MKCVFKPQINKLRNLFLVISVRPFEAITLFRTCTKTIKNEQEFAYSCSTKPLMIPNTIRERESTLYRWTA